MSADLADRAVGVPDIRVVSFHIGPMDPALPRSLHPTPYSTDVRMFGGWSSGIPPPLESTWMSCHHTHHPTLIGLIIASGRRRINTFSLLPGNVLRIADRRPPMRHGDYTPSLLRHDLVDGLTHMLLIRTNMLAGFFQGTQRRRPPGPSLSLRLEFAGMSLHSSV